MDYFDLLTQCGLSKKESAVYLALLEHGTQTLSKISQNTHINRPALYTLLPKLQQKGIVSEVKNKKRKQYAAEHPDKIELLFNEKRERVVDQLQVFKKQYQKKKAKQPVVKFFEGNKGITFVFDDVATSVPRGGSFYRYTARTGPVTELFGDTQYSKIRESKGIERYAITSAVKAAKKKPKLNRHLRVIPADFDLFEDNVSLLIYGDKTAYIDYDSKTSFIIESSKIAKFQEKLFKLLWKKLK